MTGTVGIGEVEPPIPDMTSDEEARALALQIAQAADWLLRYGMTEFAKLIDQTELADAIAQLQAWAEAQLALKANSDHSHEQYIQRGGDTMSGALALAADPTDPLHAGTKQYIDNATAAIVAQIPPPGLSESDVTTLISNAILNLQGTPTGVVTDVNVASGNVALDAGPWATTDTYRVINASATGRVVTLPPGVSGTRTFVSARTNTRVVTLQKGTTTYRLAAGGFAIVYLDGSANYMRVIASGAQSIDFVARSGDTMTGPLVLPANPTTALQAAPKQYVDAVFNPPVVVFSETPTTSEVLAHLVFERSVVFTAGTYTYQNAARAAATGTVTISLQKNNVEFGTAVFTGTTLVVTIASTTTIVGRQSGTPDALDVIAPVSVDASLANGSIPLPCTRP